MSDVADVHRAECSLALCRQQIADPDSSDPFDLCCAMFFAGVDVASVSPRDLADVERELAEARDVLQRIVAERPAAKRNRRKPNYGWVG